MPPGDHMTNAKVPVTWSVPDSHDLSIRNISRPLDEDFSIDFPKQADFLSIGGLYGTRGHNGCQKLGAAYMEMY